MKKIATALITVFFALSAYAGTMTVEVLGEAQILNGDIASAKILAETRAKWSAIEHASQVKVSVSTVIHNADVLDESVKSEISGSVKDFKIVDEGKDGDTYWMLAHVVVEKDKAKETVSGMSMNSSIAVYMPMVSGKTVEDSHPFAEALIEELIGKGFDVVDLSNEPKIAKQLESAVLKNDMAAVRNIASNHMAGSILVGKVTVIDKGNNVGYGTVSFSIVDGEVNYRVIGTTKSGEKGVINTGSVKGRSQGATLQAAEYALSTNLAKNRAPIVASNVATAIMGENKKSVRVVLVGNNDIRQFNAFRDAVKNISWVLNVREVGINTLILDYPEKTMYLATIINKNAGYRIKEFSENEILVYPK